MYAKWINQDCIKQKWFLTDFFFKKARKKAALPFRKNSSQVYKLRYTPESGCHFAPIKDVWSFTNIKSFSCSILWCFWFTLDAILNFHSYLVWHTLFDQRLKTSRSHMRKNVIIVSALFIYYADAWLYKQRQKSVMLINLL